MLIDKLKWTRLNGHWFALFGLANIACYGLSYILPKEDYIYHFGYTSYPARMTKPIKSMMGSDNWKNIIWTAPTLILLDLYLHKRLGSLFMTKFFFFAFFSSYMFMSVFNPATGLNYRPLQGKVPSFDSFAADGSYYMGSDQLCQSLIYFTLLYHRYYILTAALILSDVLYYGPATLGGPVAGVFAALTLV